MLRRTILLAAAVALVAAGAISLAPAASAQEGSGSGDATLVGRGVLRAHGDGLAALKGRGEVHIEADRGVLLVRDIAGGAVIHVEGNGETASWNGFTVYFGAGSADIVGRHVAVIVVGNNIDLRAVGKGWAYLKGHGTYSVNGFGPFPWQPQGGFAAIDDGGEAPPAN